MDGRQWAVLKKGPLNVLLCYVLWGALPLFWGYLGELSPLCVLGYRILFSLVFISLYLFCSKRWGEALQTLRSRSAMIWLTASGLVIAVNWGSFIWAVNSGHVLDSSLAYYMYPILSMFGKADKTEQWIYKKKKGKFADQTISVSDYNKQAGGQGEVSQKIVNN